MALSPYPRSHKYSVISWLWAMSRSASSKNCRSPLPSTPRRLSRSWMRKMSCTPFSFIPRKKGMARRLTLGYISRGYCTSRVSPGDNCLATPRQSIQVTAAIFSLSGVPLPWLRWTGRAVHPWAVRISPTSLRALEPAWNSWESRSTMQNCFIVPPLSAALADAAPGC